ncbi:putative NASP-related protein Sim3p [[Candida] railenensis]|uniref:NASP-related protein Sim3p n=1 Tax=[Candida] railenensis TaxID=45579 RepID=A0A9P0VX21_9ASCO|nr:putative NASP-related protein Sim3p [[Candida] railenensis]
MYSKEIQTLLSEGSVSYAAKEYDAASEKYAEACELYSTENGADDADLLLLYGKALYQGAVSKSEVFGGQPQGDNKEASGEDKAEGEGEGEEDDDDGNFQFLDVAEEVGDEKVAAADEEDEDEEQVPLAEEDEEDEEHSKDQDQEQEQEAAEGEEQSDFEVAWEILDLTRSLFEAKLADLSTTLVPPYLASDNEESSDEYINLTKKLSETYDLLGEVSLESENFTQSAIDLENCLALREKLYNPDKSSLISESHYKLSLALEFCVEDPKSKSKAIEHLKIAIKLVQERNVNETDARKKKDNDELAQDLLVKLDELQREEEPDFDEQKLDILKGILGQPTTADASGSKPAASGSSNAIINDLSSAIKKKKSPSAPQVNDLSSMVKKRKPASKDGKTMKKPKQ